jgi:hypothetical protein
MGRRNLALKCYDELADVMNERKKLDGDFCKKFCKLNSCRVITHKVDPDTSKLR